jgi:hypothetical protein
MPFLGSIESTTGYGRATVAAASSGDKIAASLTTSLAAYNAAATGAWVKITSTEYTNLQTNVTGTSVAGLTTTNLNSIASTNFTSSSLSFCNRTSAGAPSIVANQYVYAFAIYTGSSLSDIRVYANNSTSTYSGFNQLGGTLPATTTSSRNYYVLKGVSTVSAATDGLLAASTSNVLPVGFSQSAGGFGVRYTSTVPLLSGTTLTSSFLNGTSAFAIQCLTTGSIQW